ncbi:hypothetical protein FRB93_001377 [Tulasnella sp. JGI-2019a]|nr:hypothetical protein FRB93_001377 [Tulasnella sp. JGI-2019a]
MVEPLRQQPSTCTANHPSKPPTRPTPPLEWPINSRKVSILRPLGEPARLPNDANRSTPDTAYIEQISEFKEAFSLFDKGSYLIGRCYRAW